MGDQVACLQAGAGTGRTVDGCDHLDQALFHRHLDADTAELASGTHLHFAVEVRRHIVRMRIELVEKSAKGRGHQFRGAQGVLRHRRTFLRGFFGFYLGDFSCRLVKAVHSQGHDTIGRHGIDIVLGGDVKNLREQVELAQALSGRGDGNHVSVECGGDLSQLGHVLNGVLEAGVAEVKGARTQRRGIAACHQQDQERGAAEPQSQAPLSLTASLSTRRHRILRRRRLFSLRALRLSLCAW